MLSLHARLADHLQFRRGGLRQPKDQATRPPTTATDSAMMSGASDARRALGHHLFTDFGGQGL